MKKSLGLGRGLDALIDTTHIATAGSSSISEIARTVGFTDAFYFCRLFHKVYGLSPKKYRSAFICKEDTL